MRKRILQKKQLPFWIFYNPDYIGHDVYIEEFGFGVCTPKYIFSETRKNNLLQFVLDGIAHVTIGNDKPFSVSQGEAFYLPASIPHTYESDETFPTTRAWISWSGESSAFFEPGFKTTSSRYLLKITDLEAVKNTFDQLKNARNRTRFSLLTIYSCFFHLLSNCTTNNPIQQESGNIENYDQLLMNDIVKYIDNNISDTLSVHEIAENFGYHTSSLFRKFKTFSGLSLKEYIQHRRIALAKGLICETNFDINEIVIRCGYQNTAALNALFLRHENISLSKYIKEHRHLTE